MKVVLDTNVVVSAFLTPLGNSAIILRMVLNQEVEVFTSTIILAEYEQVLSRPKFSGKLQLPDIQRFFEIFGDISIRINSSPARIRLPDPTDLEFYSVAKAAKALLVTGNKRHYPDEEDILSPAEFLDLYHLFL